MRLGGLILVAYSATVNDIFIALLPLWEQLYLLELIKGKN